MTLVQWKNQWRKAVAAEETELSFSDWYASERKRSWNHAFTIAWSVSGSQHDDWGRCLQSERRRVLDALKQRVLELETNEGEFHSAIEGFDTYEES